MSGLPERATAVGNVFIACAAVVTREGRSYDSWLSEVTKRFKAAWKVIEPAAEDTQP